MRLCLFAVFILATYTSCLKKVERQPSSLSDLQLVELGLEAPSCHSREAPELLNFDSLGNYIGSTDTEDLEDMLPLKPDLSAEVQEQLATHDKNIKIHKITKPSGEKKLVVHFKNFIIDRIYRSMYGPWKRRYLKFQDEGQADQPRTIWISRYRAEVLDQDGEALQEFMCHTNVDFVGTPHDPYAYLRSQLSISQGQKELRFPPGFGLKVKFYPENQLDLNVMVLNNNEKNINKKVDFRSTISYWPEDVAKSKNMQPLFQLGVAASCSMYKDDQGNEACKPASKTADYIDPDNPALMRTGHWVVPPGEQRIVSDVSHDIARIPYDTTVHYIWMHVHPYARSLELYDKTLAKSIWKGKVLNHSDPARATILRTDFYSSIEGLQIYKSHKYEMRAIYYNPTKKDVDAMASFWMYLKAKEKNPSLLSKKPKMPKGRKTSNNMAINKNLTFQNTHTTSYNN